MKLKSALMGAAAALALAAPALAERGADGHLNILYWQAVSTLNPYLSGGTKDIEAASLVIEPLARTNNEGVIVPWLVTEVPTVQNGGVSEDLTSITWKIAPGILWADGTPLTAADVVFTWQYCTAEGGGCAQEAKFNGVASVEALDDLTVKVTFEGPTPYPYGPFVGAQSPILQAAQFANCLGEAAQSCTEANTRPIGTGPFRVTEFLPDDVVSFEANPNFRDPARPAFATATIKGGGDAAAATGGARQQVRIFALLAGHGVDHGLAAFELNFALFQHFVGNLLTHARNQLHDAAEGAHALHEAHLLEEVIEVEFGFQDLFS